MKGLTYSQLPYFAGSCALCWKTVSSLSVAQCSSYVLTASSAETWGSGNRCNWHFPYTWNAPAFFKACLYTPVAKILWLLCTFVKQPNHWLQMQLIRVLIFFLTSYGIINLIDIINMVASSNIILGLKNKNNSSLNIEF